MCSIWKYCYSCAIDLSPYGLPGNHPQSHEMHSRAQKITIHQGLSLFGDKGARLIRLIDAMRGLIVSDISTWLRGLQGDASVLQW